MQQRLTTAESIDLTRQLFLYYRKLGWNPLPSRTDAKRPLVRFRQWWDTQAPEGVFDDWPTTNLQIMTGRRWKLMVIDLDGQAGMEQWPKLIAGRPIPATWQIKSGPNGMHLWFTLPPGDIPIMRKGFLWKGPGKHEGIERLCDRSLVMAPPSIHPDTKRPYQFTDAAHSPVRMAKPAVAPWWLVKTPTVSLRLEESTGKWTPYVPAKKVPSRLGRSFAQEVREAVHDKAQLARDYGLRLEGSGPDSGGWWSCHALGREDRTPSAQIHVDSGFYVDFGGEPSRLPFFDLLAALRHTTWEEVCEEVGARYGVTKETCHV